MRDLIKKTVLVGLGGICLLLAAHLNAGTAGEASSEAVVSDILNSSGSKQLGTVWKVRGSPLGGYVAKRLIIELDSSDRLRRNSAACALKGFGPYGGDGVAAKLRDLIRKDPEGVSPCAIEALAEAGIPLSVTLREAPALLRINPNFDYYIEGPLAMVGKPLVPLLVDTLSNRDLFKKHLAISVLAKIGPEAAEAVPALKALLLDQTYNTDLSAAYALLQIVPEDLTSVDVLLKSLAQKRGNTYYTVTVLAKNKDLPEVQRALNAALNDKDAAVNRAAAMALGKAPRQSAVEKYAILRWLSFQPLTIAIWIYALFPIISAVACALVFLWSMIKFKTRRNSRFADLYLAVSASSGVFFLIAMGYILLHGPFNRFHM